ncbi:hypothetical protein EGW08_003464 [Elysia chlorotica]|uniref:EGF-like domain-containing protein n=1 Tax=Elysia chlorotica TaxID=188477 RepID=A0A3S1BU42_ELYCH|nr:hypothetical protein EGW08_003464 [Elysia chlorotica]
MDTGRGITRACLVFLTLYLCAAVSVTGCPDGPNATCCACVSSPGCSWFTPPDAQPYCSSSPYVLGGLPAWAQGGSGVTPSQPSEVTLHINKPFNLGGRRQTLITPQAATVRLAVGVRHQFFLRLSARSARTRLIVRGPAQTSAGHVEFGLRPADSDSCSRGLREFTPVRRGGRRGGGVGRAGSRRRGVVYRTAAARSIPLNRYTRQAGAAGGQGGGHPTRRVYSCLGDGPRVVHDLLLELDVMRCMARNFTVTVTAIDSRVRSRPLRVQVQSLCDCPGCSSGHASDDDTPDTSPSPAVPSPDCDMVDRCGGANVTDILSPQARLCLRRAVNDVCVSEGDASGAIPAGQACSGRGTCVCGECACAPRHELFQSERYSGTRCECDNYSCPYASGMMCGGPSRGRCQCGQCVCHADWTGQACEVSLSLEGCQSGGSVCSGRGMCVSGACECPMPYTGQFCECDDQACPSD